MTSSGETLKSLPFGRILAFNLSRFNGFLISTPLASTPNRERNHKHLHRPLNYPTYRCDNTPPPVDKHCTQTVHTSQSQHDSPSSQTNPQNRPDVYPPPFSPPFCQGGTYKSELCSNPSIIPFASPNRRYSGLTVIAVT
jgi:hypothetical protein